MEAKLEKVTLGAGLFYVAPFTGGAIDFTTLIKPENKMGYTSGGAEITYTPETKTIEDDAGYVRRTFQSKANAEMKTGLLTFDIQSLNALMSVGQITKVDPNVGTAGKHTLKLGGGKAALRKFCVAFVYEDDETGGQIRVGMVATNTTPLSLKFTKDAETVPDITFTAESNGVDDVIIVIEDDILPEGFTLTEDTSVQSSKTYYEKDGINYEAVESPTGNPKSQGWYEYDDE